MSGDFDYDFLCIGSGPAGQRAAVQAAKLRKRVGIVECEVEIGGVCVHTGTMPSKTFREAVLSLADGSDAFHVGYGGGGGSDGPVVERLYARVGDIVFRESRVQREQLRRNGVDIIPGMGSFAGPHEVAVRSSQGTRNVSAGKILVATGTKPARPAKICKDLPCVITSDDILKLDELPRTMVVIGCGVIGVEYASMFAALGVEVTVVDGRTRPLEFLDSEIVDELVHQMRAKEVSFRLGEAVDRIELREGDAPNLAVVHLESGKRLVADLVLASTGRVGASESLDLDKVGLTADARGRLAVGATFQTEVPHIYAAGDIIGFPSLAATSSEQGRLAACHAFGVEAGPMPLHFPVGIYAIPEISMVGRTELDLTNAKIPYETGVARYREIARGQILGDDSGFLKLIFHAENRKLLGVHAIGTGATELIHVGQSVIALGGGLDYFMTTVFNYPTLAECYKVAAFDAYNRLSV
ncbi:MAG: Si-specific NAD(P)(+) transhydrogenase [Rhodospirillales bacterium]